MATSFRQLIVNYLYMAPRLTQPPREGGMALMGAIMRFAVFGILAALACAQPANAVVFEINATYSLDPSSSIHGSFTMDSSIGPASISNVDIHATLPIVGGSFDFSFDGVYQPAITWPVGYLWFVNSAYYAGDTHFWMGFHYDTSLDDGSYLIGMWGNPFNPHPSEISVAGVNGWLGIVGQMTVAVPGPIVGAGLPGLLMAVAGLIGWRRSRRSTF
jgi:hypothetical protein